MINGPHIIQGLIEIYRLALQVSVGQKLEIDDTVWTLEKHKRIHVCQCN